MKNLNKLVNDMRRMKEHWDGESPRIIRSAANFYINKLIDEYVIETEKENYTKLWEYFKDEKI